MEDALGDRIKSKFEDAYRLFIPQRTYAILRIDGKAFHTFTRHKSITKPYCQELANSMDFAATALCKEIMGCRLAYGQSDEYSFLFSDFDRDETEMWFSGNIQKIASVSASIFTAAFNWQWQAIRPAGFDPSKLAMFDARVFVIAQRSDVAEYFNWRQLDASRNSLNMLASCYFSHKDLQGRKSADKHEMLHTVGQNWNNYRADFKRGRVIRRVSGPRTVTYTHKVTKEIITKEVTEATWTVDKDIPVFNREQTYLDALIPPTFQIHPGIPLGAI